MNTKILIAVVVFIALVALGVGLYLTNSKKSTTTTNSPAATQGEAQQPAGNPQSIAELFQKAMTSGSLKCTYSSDTMSGTTYIKNGNISFSATDSTTKKVMHSIIKNKTMWTWNDGETKGMMLDMSKLEANITPPQGATSPEDIQKQVEANKPNCTEEAIADSTFDVPSNVTFTDLSKMMESIPKVTLPAGFKMPEGVPSE